MKQPIYDVSDRKLCKECVYWYSYAEMCGYSSTTEELRTVKMGQKRLKPGTCDKYKSGERRERKVAFNHGKI